MIDAIRLAASAAQLNTGSITQVNRGWHTIRRHEPRLAVAPEIRSISSRRRKSRDGPALPLSSLSARVLDQRAAPETYTRGAQGSSLLALADPEVRVSGRNTFRPPAQLMARARRAPSHILESSDQESLQ